MMAYGSTERLSGSRPYLLASLNLLAMPSSRILSLAKPVGRSRGRQAVDQQEARSGGRIVDCEPAEQEGLGRFEVNVV